MAAERDATFVGLDENGDGGRKRRNRSRLARSQLVIFLNFCLSAVFFAVLTAGALVYWGAGEYEARGPLKQEMTYVVPRRSGVQEIAEGLERNGIISNAEVFTVAARLTDSASSLKAGEYAFLPGASMREVMEKIERGDSILHNVTIPEGWTVEQAYARIADLPFLAGEMPDLLPEGTLRPDTYLVQRGTTRSEVIQQMKEAQNRLVSEIWEKRDPDIPVSDIGEFLTLASIVERETGLSEERAHVASVFVNRLREGMPLQSDPTFLYGVYGGAGKPADSPVTQADKDSDTPYNTYKIKGLPPGPIANPGRAALEAVANPLDTDDFYFVADGSGGHVFAETYEEHQRNVAAYRQLQSERRAANEAE